MLPLLCLLHDFNHAVTHLFVQVIGFDLHEQYEYDSMSVCAYMHARVCVCVGVGVGGCVCKFCLALQCRSNETYLYGFDVGLCVCSKV